MAHQLRSGCEKKRKKKKKDTVLFDQGKVSKHNHRASIIIICSISIKICVG
jgi:hypothetical protein